MTIVIDLMTRNLTKLTVTYIYATSVKSAYGCSLKDIVAEYFDCS